MSSAKQKSVWGIALKAGTIQATQVFGSRKDAEDAIAKISHLSNGFEAVELGPVNSPELPDGWIPCAERMPADGDLVLVWDGKYRYTCFRMIGFWQSRIDETTITHWMELPASPTTEK